MGFNKREHLEKNIRALEIAFGSRQLSTEEYPMLKAYSGFGALKCVLRPAESDEDIAK